MAIVITQDDKICDRYNSVLTYEKCCGPGKSTCGHNFSRIFLWSATNVYIYLINFLHD